MLRENVDNDSASAHAAKAQNVQNRADNAANIAAHDRAFAFRVLGTRRDSFKSVPPILQATMPRIRPISENGKTAKKSGGIAKAKTEAIRLRSTTANEMIPNARTKPPRCGARLPSKSRRPPRLRRVGRSSSNSSSRSRGAGTGAGERDGGDAGDASARNVPAVIGATHGFSDQIIGNLQLFPHEGHDTTSGMMNLYLSKNRGSEGSGVCSVRVGNSRRVSS